jgi:hypothetical protein
VRDGSLERVQKGAGGASEVLRARTDAEGRFAFRGIPPRSRDDVRYAFTLTAKHPKFEPVEEFFKTDAGPRSDMEFTLQPGSRIGGTVLDEAGKPVANALIRAFPLPSANFRPETQTNAEGRFRFDNLPPGDWQVVVVPDYQAEAWVSASASREAPTELKIAVPKGEYLAGKVIGPDGKPAPNSAVGWLRLLNSDGKPVDQPNPDRITHTGADGTFRLGPVPAGTYLVVGLIDPPRSEAYAVGKTGQTDIVILHHKHEPK